MKLNFWLNSKITPVIDNSFQLCNFNHTAYFFSILNNLFLIKSNSFTVYCEALQCYVCLSRGRQVHSKLRLGDLQMKTDTNGHEFVELYVNTESIWPYILLFRSNSVFVVVTSKIPNTVEISIETLQKYCV